MGYAILFHEAEVLRGDDELVALVSIDGRGQLRCHRSRDPDRTEEAR